MQKPGFVLLVAAMVFAQIGLAQTGFAQTTKNNVIIINGGRNAIYTKTPTTIASSYPELAKLNVIYNLLGPANDRYSSFSGVGILGVNAGQPWPERVANGFVPTADSIVTAVAVGASHVSGENSIILTLAEDNNGTPGKTLHAWRFTNLPEFGTCCVLQIGRASGIPIKKGQMYWVILEPTTRDSDGYQVWDDDFNGFSGAFNNDIGSGWQGQSFQNLGGFGVFGN